MSFIGEDAHLILLLLISVLAFLYHFFIHKTANEKT
jgi:hypothetical protein